MPRCRGCDGSANGKAKFKARILHHHTPGKAVGASEESAVWRVAPPAFDFDPGVESQA